MADAWAMIKVEKEMIRRSFLTCGLPNNVDGSENDQVNIGGLEGYTLPKPETEFHLESSDEDEDSEESGRECEVGEVQDVDKSEGD